MSGNNYMACRKNKQAVEMEVFKGMLFQIAISWRQSKTLPPAAPPPPKDHRPLGKTCVRMWADRGAWVAQ